MVVVVDEKGRTFHGTFADGSKARRDTLTARAFERLSQAYPDDQDAKAFYAL